MDVHVIPYQNAYLVYRPLKRLAFAANLAMTALARAMAEGRASPGDLQSEAGRFLTRIGFAAPDPPAPASSPLQAAPTTVVCLLTNTCNMHCIYCYASGGEMRTREEMPLELGCRAIDIVHQNAEEAGAKSFALSLHGGGEPTLAKGAFKALVVHARSKRLPCRISVASNGVWSHSLRDWILDHLDEVSLSLDGTQAMQDHQRPLLSGRGSFDRVMESIRAMDHRGFTYGIRLTVTDWGIEHLPSAISQLCDLTGCQTFQVEPAFGQGRARHNATQLTDTRRFAKAFLQAYEMASAQGRHLYYSGARPWVLTDRFCQAVENALIVTPRGELSACYEVFGASHELAPLFFVGSLDVKAGPLIDEGAKARLRARIEQRREGCRDCFCYWHCAGDCPPKNLSPDAQADGARGLRCALNRELTAELLARKIADAGGLWQGQDRNVLIESEA